MKIQSLYGIRNRGRLVLMSFILFSMAYHILGYTGHYGYDDMHYAELAHGWTQGDFEADDHYSYRFTVIGFTAISYLFFGVNDFASSLPSLLLFISMIILVYFMLRNERLELIIVTLSLMVFQEWLLFYSDKIMPDIHVAFSAFLAFFIYWKQRFDGESKPFSMGMMFSMALFYGFLSKGSILLCLPLAMYLMVLDFSLKRERKFWFMVLFSGLALLIVYGIVIWTLTGNALSRFEALDSNSYLSLCSYDSQPLAMLLERLSYGLIRLLLLQGMFFSVAFLLIFLFQRINLDVWRCDSAFSYFITASLVLLLSSNFMTISFSSYNPMCLDSRHYLFLVPILALPAGRIVYHFSLRKYQGLTSLLIFVIILILSELDGRSRHMEDYLLILILLATSYFIPNSFRKNMRFALLFALVLMLIPFENMHYARQVKYKGQRQFVYEIIKDQKGQVVITDDVQKRLANYYQEFDKEGIQFVSFKEFRSLSPNKESFLLYNPYTSHIGRTEFPYYVDVIRKSGELLKKSEENGMEFYALQSLPEFRSFYSEIHHFNLLRLEHWSEYEQFTQDGNEKMARFFEYSPTFTIKLNQETTKNGLIAKLTFKIKQSTENQVYLIAVLEKEGSEYHRESLVFDQHIKSIGKWYDVKREFFLPGEKIQNNSNLTIYLWNPSAKEIHLDDFGIDLAGLLDEEIKE